MNVRALFYKTALTQSMDNDSQLDPRAAAVGIFGDLLIKDNLSDLTNTSKKTTSETISINVKCVYPDPQNPGEMIQKVGSVTAKATDSVTTVVETFKGTFPDIPNKTYYLGYDQLLFREGKLAECGITQGKSVELYAPGKNAAAYHNEGLSLVVWSLIPFVIGLASLLFSITTGDSVDNDYQAMFLFLGLVLLIPSCLCIVMGLILIPECPMPCYFNGTEWC